MPKEEMKLINLRVPVALFVEYKKFCDSNNTNVSSALREHIKDDLDIGNSVKTPGKRDFRDSLNGSIHGRSPLW